MSNYVRNILTISGATFFSQIVLIVSIPFITRIYSPEDLGIAAFFLAVSNIISTIATLKYDLAIFIPSDEEEISNIFTLSILINFIMLLGVLVISLPIYLFIFPYLNFTLSFFWLLAFFLFFVLNGLVTILTAWLNKNKKYYKISIGRIIKDLVLTAAIIFFGLINPNPIYLVLANLIGLSLCFFYYLVVFKNNNSYQIQLLSVSSYMKLLKKYSDFPKFSLPSAFINILTSQSPIILLTTFFGSSASGLLSLVNRVLGAPSKLISSATSEVFREKASDQFNKNGNCEKLYKKTFIGLLMLSIIPFFILLIFSPGIFNLAFGEEWVQAGYFARYMSLFFLLQFCISPLGFVLIIANKQKVNLLWQIFLLISTSMGILIGYLYQEISISIILFSIIYSLMYLIYYRLTYKFSKG